MAKGKTKSGYMWTEAKKFEVVTTYLATGSLRLSGAVCGVPEDTIRHWHMTDWWKSMEAEIRTSENTEISTRLKKIIDKSLDTVIDRLDQGDPMYNPRTGEIIRIPVKAVTAIKALESAVDKRQVLNNQPTKITEQRTIDDRLANLMAKFEQMSNMKTINQEPELLPEIQDGGLEPQ